MLCWELKPSATGTKLMPRHIVENSEWIIPSAAGWHVHLDIAEILLDGRAVGPLSFSCRGCHTTGLARTRRSLQQIVKGRALTFINNLIHNKWHDTSGSVVGHFKRSIQSAG